MAEHECRRHAFDLETPFVMTRVVRIAEEDEVARVAVAAVGAVADVVDRVGAVTD